MASGASRGSFWGLMRFRKAANAHRGENVDFRQQIGFSKSELTLVELLCRLNQYEVHQKYVAQCWVKQALV